MKLQFTLGAVLILLMFSSCKKDKQTVIEDLTLTADSFILSEMDDLYVNILHGNRDYTVEVEDENLIDVSVDPRTYPAGNIKIVAKAEGQTALTVKDNITAQTVTIDIHVVSPFLVVRAGQMGAIIEDANTETTRAIQEEIKDFAPFANGEFIVLHQAAVPKFYVFESWEDLSEGLVDRSGQFSLDISYGGLHRLMMKDVDSDQVQAWPLHVQHEEIFFRLLDFSRKAPSGHVLAEEVTTPLMAAKAPQATSVVAHDFFFIYQDLTNHFEHEYPDVTRVEAFQYVHLRPVNAQVAIGGNFLLSSE